jgi:hypothetical protein
MAKPKLALIPAAQGSKLFSVLPSSGVGDFDFSRSGKATRINSQGLIEEVDDGVSRLNYPMIDGKVVGCPHHILEPARTNIFQRSEEFSNAYWNISRIETPYIADVVSPDGTLNAYTLEISNGETNGGGVYRSGISISGDNSWSVFAKKKTANYLVLADTGTTTNAAYFDLENGTVGTTYNATGEMQDFGNGWYRCTMKYTLTSSGIKFIYLSNLDGATNGGVVGGDSIYIYGAQLEQGSYPTSYIKTNGSAVTRSAETANGSGDADTFNDSEGVLMAEISALDNDEIKEITLSNGGNAERILLSYNSIGRLDVNVIASDTYQAAFNYTNINSTEFNKILISYKQNDFKLFVNGFKVGNSLSGNIPSGLDTINFGATYNASVNSFYGNTKQIQYYDSALTDSDLEELTSWTSFSDMANGQLYTIE